MRTMILLAFCIFTTACSGGSNYAANPQVQRLLVDVYSLNGAETVLSFAGPRTPAFGAVTYYVYGTTTDMGSQSIVPLALDRLDEQAFGPFAYGDTAQDIDLSPWDDFDYIYVRALVVTPNKGWKIVPGKLFEFSTN